MSQRGGKDRRSKDIGWFPNLTRIFQGDLHNSKNLRMRKVWRNGLTERMKSILIVLMFVVVWFALRKYLDSYVVVSKRRFKNEL